MNINQPQSLEEIQKLLGELPSAELPAALFPVRLETRFTTEAGKIYLCVRIYPDDLHLDTHEPLLTEEEVQWGKQLWEQVWLSGRDPAMERAIQKELAERFGVGRAAWIAKTLKPLNPQDRSDRPDSLPVKPIYPTVKTRADSWTSPPQLRAMPDRWVLLVYRHGEPSLSVVSNPVNPNLKAGFEPQEPDPEDEKGKSLLAQRDDNTVLPLDEGMKWMVDFDEAVAQGMGFRIELASRQEAETGYDRLIVLGIDTQSSAKTLTALLESQRYTDSLDFVPQGSPSNNTGEAKAQYAETEPEQETELLTQKQEQSPPEDCNCHVTARALGIVPEIFAQLPHTVEREQADARAMNAALWPATWGYFFRYMLNHVNGHLSDEAIEALRNYFIKYVRARGPIPTLRVGHQPYGILPVTSLNLYQPDGNNEEEVFGDRGLEVLKILRHRWQQCLDGIPKVQPPTSTNDSNQSLSQILADILGMSATSDTFLGRMGLDGILYGVPQPSPNGLPISQDDTIHNRHRQAMAAFNQLDTSLNLPDYSLPAASLVFTEPIVKISTSVETGESINFAAIKDASFNQLLTEAGQQQPLALLLRHSMLLAYLDTAYNLNRIHGLIQPENHRDPSLIGILTDPVKGDAEDTATLLDLVAVPAREFGIGDPNSQQSLADVIDTLKSSEHPPAKILEDMQESLVHLGTVVPEQLNYLLGETLDLASHRLDAWITSLATARLDSLRQKQSEGIILGGYGWVENLKLKPISGRVLNQMGDRIPVAEIPPDEDENGQLLYDNTGNGGYVVAPSLNQGAMAAILRSGYLNSDTQSPHAPFAIDLSSDRVRLAKWLLDGVRQGQNLSALLGYRFERGLQEQGLAEYILPFRKLVPFAEQLRQSGMSNDKFIERYSAIHLTPREISKEAIESMEAQHVVDGLELMRLWQEQKITFGHGQNQIVLHQNSDRNGLEAQLNHLVATVDAISDLVTAESVFQLTQGNELLAGATLDSIAKGDTPPPNPEFVRTPRTGVAHTQRVSVIFSGEVKPLETWSTNSFQQRTRMEPHLDRWLAELLGDSRQIKIKIAFWDPKTDTQIEAIPNPVPLWNFGISPLDAICVATTNETGRGSPLEALINYRIMRSRSSRIPPDATLRFFYEGGADEDAEEIDFGTFLELARAVRELITNIRPLDARDLASPENDTSQNFDLDELNRRARHIVNYLTIIRNHLATDIEASAAEDYDLDRLRVSIFRFFYTGLNEAVPVAAKDDEPSAKANLIEQGQNILIEANRRLALLDKIESSIDRRTASAQEKIEVDTKRIKLVLGQDFPVLPKFTAANVEELSTTFAHSNSLQNDDPLAGLTWLGQMAHVRDGCDRLNTCLNYGEMLYQMEINYSVGQLPYNAGDRWVALPQEAANPITEPRVGLMAVAPNGLTLESSISGMMVDEWVETIPNTQELAAAAFHFDAPQSQAPQAILLAVPPAQKDKWELKTLEKILSETLDLAKLRTVDNAALFEKEENGHFLPALYFAFNAQQESSMLSTVSTNFASVAENISQQVLPSLKAITPSSGLVGESLEITITGDNLAEAKSVIFPAKNGSPEISATDVRAISNSEIKCNVTLLGNAMPRDFIVDTEHNGMAQSQNFGITFQVQIPTITRITPKLNNGASTNKVFNRETTTVIINGTNLAKVTAVNFFKANGSLEKGMTTNIIRQESSNTSLKCRVTVSSSVKGEQKKFNVVTPYGSVQNNSLRLTVKERPVIESIKPTKVFKGIPKKAARTTLTITGKNLYRATSVKLVGGSSRGIIVGSPSVVSGGTKINCSLSLSVTVFTGKRRVEVTFDPAEQRTLNGTAYKTSNYSLELEIMKLDLGPIDDPINPKKPFPPFNL